MKSTFLIIFLLALFLFSCKENPQPVETANMVSTDDPYTLVGAKNFLTGYAPMDADGNIQVVVEIPTGTVDKWEVDKTTGNMKWEFRNGAPRKVKYLGYPGNYGMIPQTLLPLELGGDGDPLDVIVLGPAVERGSVVKAKLIGVLKLLDSGEQDDKLIAVMENTPFYQVNSLEELNLEFKGLTTIVETFFTNYKGPGEMESLGFAEAEEAQQILNDAIEEYKK